MPSPFPGMDPFIEGQVWEDFRHELVSVAREALIPEVRPHYVVRVEERVYVERLPNGAPGLTLPMPEDMHEAYLTVRERETLEVVTVIGVLSPTNKRPGADGRREYLHKREQVLRSRAHLVELDLLRGGERLPTLEPLPSGDYFAIICRERERPQAEVYAWSLRHPLPPIPVPLAAGDPDVELDLQAVFDTVYDRTGYDYSLDYGRQAEPPLGEAAAAWVDQVLNQRAPAG